MVTEMWLEFNRANDIKTPGGGVENTSIGKKRGVVEQTCRFVFKNFRSDPVMVRHFM
ncbi:MAG: hypothetical protein CM15mP9_4690 [Methanobacteriota archaeon]|nr:MAG: hypothetical protein CM15mP9_4690 [Euryarchaeota archaeon]